MFSGRPPRRVLVIKPSSLGDIVHALPVLAAIRAGWPGARVAWLVGRAFAPLLEGHPLIDELILFDRSRFGRMLRSPRILAEFVRFLAALRRRRFDCVLDLQGLVRSGFLAWISGAGRRVGFTDAREFAWAFYTQRVPSPQARKVAGRTDPRRDVHAVDKNLAAARALGLPADGQPGFPLGLRPAELTAGRAIVETAAGRPVPDYIAVAPGARWASKRWPAELLAALLDRLHADGLPVCVLLGGPDDRTCVSAITAAAHVPLVDLVGRTSLRELCAVLAGATLVVCHDSGPMHLAAALGRPLVALFGPTSAARTGPHGDRARVVSLKLPCAPCYARECPLGHHACLRELDVERVVTAVREMWAASAPRAV